MLVDSSLEDMRDNADAVVRGRVLRSKTRYVQSGGTVAPVTLTQVQVRAWLKAPSGDPGQAPPPTVTIQAPGGNGRDRRTVSVIGAAHYAPGEDVVVFLDRVKNAGVVPRAVGSSAGLGSPEVSPEDSPVVRQYRTRAMGLGRFLVNRAVKSSPAYVTRSDGDVALVSWKRNVSGLRRLAPQGKLPAMQLEPFLKLLQGGKKTKRFALNDGISSDGDALW